MHFAILTYMLKSNFLEVELGTIQSILIQIL